LPVEEAAFLPDDTAIILGCRAVEWLASTLPQHGIARKATGSAQQEQRWL
jgi:hypothetical protein